MAVKLKSPIKRLIRVYGLDSDVILTIDELGVYMQVPGTKLKISIGWHEIASHAHTPLNVPSYLEGRPIEMLKHMMAKKVKKQCVLKN